MENNNEMKWVNLTYEKTVTSTNTGRFMTSLDPEMVELWLKHDQPTDEDDIEMNIEGLTQSEEWEESKPKYENLKTSYLVDNDYFGKGEMDDYIQSWINNKRVDMTSIFGSGHNPLEIQDFISEHQELFNKLTTRKTIFHLKDNEKSVYYSLRKIVGLEGERLQKFYFEGESLPFHLTHYVEWGNTEGKVLNGYLQLKEEGWVRHNDETWEKWKKEQEEIGGTIPLVQSPKDNVVQMRKRTSSN
jgi:hypothetical protein